MFCCWLWCATKSAGAAGPGAIELFEHALCDVARLPVREVVSATHYITDLTLGLGEVAFDYLQDA